MLISRIILKKMNINIKATNFELSDRIRTFVEEKTNGLEKLVDCVGESVHVWVEIEKDKKHRSGDIFRSELQFRLPDTKAGIRAEERGKNWRISFNGAIKKAKRELKDYKEKKCDKVDV